MGDMRAVDAGPPPSDDRPYAKNLAAFHAAIEESAQRAVAPHEPSEPEATAASDEAAAERERTYEAVFVAVEAVMRSGARLARDLSEADTAAARSEKKTAEGWYKVCEA